MGRRKHKSWRVKVTPEAMEKIAAALVPNHAGLLSRGYVMCGTSGLWRTRRGTFTGRFAYREGVDRASFVHTVRGINLGGDDV